MQACLVGLLGHIGDFGWNVTEIEIRRCTVFQAAITCVAQGDHAVKSPAPCIKVAATKFDYLPNPEI